MSSQTKPQNIKNEKKAMLYSIIPGLGQFYNGQRFKGIVFLAILVAFVVEMIVLVLMRLTD